MLDVAAVAETILEQESPANLKWLSAQLGIPSENLPRYLAMLAGLHDFGKAIPGFQAKWPEGKVQDEAMGLVFAPERALKVERHDMASKPLLDDQFLQRFGRESWIRHVSSALAAHHGYMPRQDEICDAKPLAESKAWQDARCALFDAYWHTLVPNNVPSQQNWSLPLLAWLAGLTSIADWIGSNQDWFPCGERGESLLEHFAAAKNLAAYALMAIGWGKYAPLLQDPGSTSELLGQILGKSKAVTPRPLQLEADQLLSQAHGPALMIVEAPMGEGKTELAFLAHLRLQACNGHRGLYIALPTQATGNAMFNRTLVFLDKFQHGLPLDIQLAHGGAGMNEQVIRLKSVDDASRGESVSSSSWFSQRRRALVSPNGVGTIDQALFATLHVKHHFVRLWGLANRVVVLDEVHAYDTYTSGLIEALLRWLKALNCSVILMSATLPTDRRDAFLAAWDTQPPAPCAYPRLLLASQGGVEQKHIPARPLSPIEVSGLPDDLEQIADTALACLDAGGCGAVIVNTVKRAQALYQILQAKLAPDTELLLFHARYPADERGQREHAVLARFGQNSVRPARALLIATQVVEQSLDIDFDFLISDLAPVDLLLQRAGRLHRHQRNRPEAHACPRLMIAGLLADRLPELKETAWGFVYDSYILYRTWALLIHEPVWRLPEDIDRLVQAVYGLDSFPEEAEQSYACYFDEAFGKHLAEAGEFRKSAMAAAIEAEAEPQNAYLQKPRGDEDGNNLGIRAITRLGSDSMTLIPVHVGPDGWRIYPDDPPFSPATLTDQQASQLFRRQVRLSRPDILQAYQGQETPAAFADHPLLRYLHMLELHDNCAPFDSWQVRLDQELGVVYESLTTETEGA